MFVYPHRLQELKDYQEYMASQFGAYPDISNQNKVINFDKAVWLCVGQSNDLLLTDYHQFQDIISYHLINLRTSTSNNAKCQKLSPNVLHPITPT